MKVESISIQNFKLFENLEVSFTNSILEEVSNRFLILGDNGTGKTTLLQAIALPLALATRQISSVADFDWMGFIPGRYQNNGNCRIELKVLFEDEEIEATKKVAKRWYESLPDEFKKDRDFVEPGNSKSVRVILNDEYWKAGSNEAESLQFLGRFYAQKLLKSDPSIRQEFPKLPGIFYFDQFRQKQMSNPYAELTRDSFKNSPGGVYAELAFGGRLRQYLIESKVMEKLGDKYSNNGWLIQLGELYNKFFPERSFGDVEYGLSWDSLEENIYFTLKDGKHSYDLAEMSGGELSIFPILYEFAREKIGSSVVLIDAIDLNLHPPGAQLLVRQIRKIKPVNQFILTTHSEAVRDLISVENTYRFKGGSICL